MEQHELTKKEYDAIHSLNTEKRAVKELLESLKTQLAQTLLKEDRWWKKMANKHGLDHEMMHYSIDHDAQAIIGAPKPPRVNTPHNMSQVAVPPAMASQQAPNSGTQVRIKPGPRREEMLMLEQDK